MTGHLPPPLSNPPVCVPHVQVKCLTKVFHPNIDLEGNICLNILREDWKPVLTITSIVYGLNFLFLASGAAEGLVGRWGRAELSRPRSVEGRFGLVRLWSGWVRKAWGQAGCLGLAGRQVVAPGGMCRLGFRVWAPTPHKLCVPLQAPNPDDPLNKEAAQMMQSNPAQFERYVATSIVRGSSIGGEWFPPCRG